MNIQLQFAVFELANAAFDLKNHLEFSLRTATNGSPRPNSGQWQRRATWIETVLQKIAAQLNQEEFRTQAETAVSAVRDRRIALVDFFEQDRLSESDLSEVQRRIDDAQAMQADWGPPDRIEYFRWIRTKVTEMLQPFWATLGSLETSLPDEYRPFFALGRLAWSIPDDLEEWGIQNAADNRQRHHHLLSVIRPDLQSLFQQCVQRQPELSNLDVGPLVLDELEDELGGLRRSVRDRLAFLSSQVPVAGGGARVVGDALIGSEDDSMLSPAAELDAGKVESHSAENTESDLSNTTDGALDSHSKVPYVNTDNGLTICGIEVEVASDSKVLLMYLCDSVNKQPYEHIIYKIAESRSPTNVEAGWISIENARTKMHLARNALRAAFNDDSDPMEEHKREHKMRYKLNREWLTRNACRIKQEIS